VGGNPGILDFGGRSRIFLIQTASGPHLVPVQHIEHAPEASAIAVVHARIMRDVRLRRPARRQVLEELHVRRDPECDRCVARSLDDEAVDDRRVSEPAGAKAMSCSTFACDSSPWNESYPDCALNQSMISPPAAFQTP